MHFFILHLVFFIFHFILLLAKWQLKVTYKKARKINSIGNCLPFCGNMILSKTNGHEAVQMSNNRMVSIDQPGMHHWRYSI